MEELLQLRRYLEQQDYARALDLVAEMEEMSCEDKINKIRALAKILLLHLIKQEAERRTTRSWELSILNATHEISYINRRRKAGGYYLSTSELQEVIAEAYPLALKHAALAAFEGQHDDVELGQMVDQALIEQKALDLIITQQDAKR